MRHARQRHGATGPPAQAHPAGCARPGIPARRQRPVDLPLPLRRPRSRHPAAGPACQAGAICAGGPDWPGLRGGRRAEWPANAERAMAHRLDRKAWPGPMPRGMTGGGHGPAFPHFRHDRRAPSTRPFVFVPPRSRHPAAGPACQAAAICADGRDWTGLRGGRRAEWPANTERAGETPRLDPRAGPGPASSPGPGAGFKAGTGDTTAGMIRKTVTKAVSKATRI